VGKHLVATVALVVVVVVVLLMMPVLRVVLVAFCFTTVAARDFLNNTSVKFVHGAHYRHALVIDLGSQRMAPLQGRFCGVEGVLADGPIKYLSLVGQTCIVGLLHRMLYLADDGPDVTLLRIAAVRLKRGSHRATRLMTQDDDKLRLKMEGCIFDAPNCNIVDYVASDAYDKEVTQSFIKDELGGYPRICARHDDGIGVLSGHKFLANLGTDFEGQMLQEAVQLALCEAGVPFLQASPCFLAALGQHRGAGDVFC